MSDGPMIGRFRVSTFVFSERRGTVYDGSERDDNPLDEHTAIKVPIISLDFRVTPRFGLQASTAIPLIARTGVVLDRRATYRFVMKYAASAIPSSAVGIVAGRLLAGTGR